MNPTTVRNLLLSLGLATGLGGLTNGCSSNEGTPSLGGAGGAGGTGGSSVPGTGGFCGNCLGQNLADANRQLDATTDSDGDGGGDMTPAATSPDSGDAGSDQSDPSGG